jgi:hypothetical protein
MYSVLYFIYSYSDFLLIAVQWKNVYNFPADYRIKNNTNFTFPSGPCLQRHNFSVYIFERSLNGRHDMLI